MGTGSTERSEISKDFLCLRLQRLRTSSDTVSKAAERGNKDESTRTRTRLRPNASDSLTSDQRSTKVVHLNTSQHKISNVGTTP